MPAQVKQPDFYQALGATKIQQIKKFQQKTNSTGVGFLAPDLIGVCAFMTLDFHRAVSQGTLEQWGSSAAMTPTDGNGLTSFGARLVTHYAGEKHYINDPLFTRTLARGDTIPDSSSKPLNDTLIEAYRSSEQDNAVWNSNTVAQKAIEQLNKGVKFIRLDFNLNKEGVSIGHSVGIAASPSSPDNVLFMEPNAGLFEMSKEDLAVYLDATENALYGDFSLSNPSLDEQQSFWLHPSISYYSAPQEFKKQEEEYLAKNNNGQPYLEIYEEDKAQALKDAKRVAEMADEDIDFPDTDEDENITAGVNFRR